MNRFHDAAPRAVTAGRCGPLLLVALAALALATACGPKEDPILALSADEALAEGKDLMSQEKYPRARPFLIHAFEVEPNSATGREALLLAADTFYLQGGSTNYLQAEAKYRDFINRFPTSDRAAYAQFQVGNSLAERMEKPDRDQTATRQALEVYEQLLRLYPTSEYAAQAREQIRRVRDNLAEHEAMVGEFYLKFRIPRAAVGRFEHLLDEYPDYSQKDKGLFLLGRSYLQAKRYDEAKETFERLRQQFPDSSYVSEIPKVPDAPPPEEAAGDEPTVPAAGGVAEGPGGRR